MRGAGRRRSTSEGEGDRLSSTLNLPEAARFNRFEIIDSNRYASTPQINVTGVIDDNLESSRGTRFESRVRTRSRTVSNAIDVKLRDDLSQLRDEIIKWGELACSVPQMMNVIEANHRTFLGNIELKISEVLVTKGDLVLVGELGNLKDRLSGIRKRDRQISKDYSGVHPQQDERVPVQESGGERNQEIMMRSCDLDYVFHNEEPIERSSPYSVVSAPIYRGREALGESRSNGAVVGSRPVASGLGSTRPNILQDLQSCNSTNRSEGATNRVQPGIVHPNPRMDVDLQPDGVRSRSTGIGGLEFVQSDSVLPSLNTPRVLRPEGVTIRRALDLDLNGSLEEVISRLSAEGLNADNQKDQWARLLKQRQNIVEEKVNNIVSGMRKLSTTVHGAEAMYLELQDKIGILENSNSKIWERLDLEDQRFDRLEASVHKLDTKLDEKVEMIQDWLVHISAQVHTDVPAELVNSIQEVIADSFRV